MSITKIAKSTESNFSCEFSFFKAWLLIAYDTGISAIITIITKNACTTSQVSVKGNPFINKGNHVLLKHSFAIEFILILGSLEMCKVFNKEYLTIDIIKLILKSVHA